MKDGVVEVIRELKKEGDEIYFITARSDLEYNNNAYDYTYKFLIDNGIMFDKLLIECNNKAKVVKDYNIDIFIDDSIDKCIEVSKLGIIDL